MLTSLLVVEEYKQRYPKLFELEADKTVDDHCISVVEKEYGLSFPDSYKNILKHIGGDYIGYEIKDNVCTENLVLWNHDGDIKNYIEKNIYEVIIICGLKNEPL